MPVKGFPDPAHHRICRRCRQWFEPEEGTQVLPAVTGPFGAMRRPRALASGDEADLQFQCQRCSRVRRIRQIVIWMVFAALVALVLLLERLGIL
jgi:hypothetical protein